MKKCLLLGLLSLASARVALGAPHLVVTVTNDPAMARPAETITVPWTAIAHAIPGARLQHLAVKDATGRVLPYQVTNLAPQAKDPGRTGAAYGELIFQHDFTAGEKTAAFTVERIEALAPVFPTRTYARYIPERLDDFAWENDKIAHRTYGPALAAPAAPGSGKEVLVTSGLDVWCKRVSYPIVDRWYNKGHDYYHHFDLDEGIDMYNVGPSRGCGGTGLWDGRKLAVSGNYRTWRILANGPIRTIFELTYDAWGSPGLRVTETKRFTVDAGHNLDQIESTFTVVEGSARELVVAVGLNKTPSDKGQEPKADLIADAAAGSLALWIAEKTNGSLGTAVIVPAGFAGFAEDERNQLILAKVTSGQPVRYYVGGGWSAAGEFTTRQAWADYVAHWALRARSPVKVTVSAVP